MPTAYQIQSSDAMIYATKPNKIIGILKVVVLLGVVVYLAVTLFHTTEPIAKKPDLTPTVNNEKQRTCPRSELYQMEPEFERAISLIKQREINSGHGSNDNWIYNCLHVQYGDVGESEGVFFFDSSVSSPDKLVIYVNPSYKNADDVLTALLLYHEIQHAGQYTLLRLYETKLSCIDAEATAFHWQFQFFRWLNEEERKSIVARVYYGELKSESIHAQIEMLKQLAVFSNIADEACAAVGSAGDWECYTSKFVPKVKEWVRSNQYYQEQCKGGL